MGQTGAVPTMPLLLSPPLLLIIFFLAAHMGADSLGYQDDDHPEKVRTLPSYVCGCRSPGSSASAALNCL